MLLLDEPTNHLDLRAKDVLLEAIANFTGTVLFVSHDRYFIDGLATRVFEVEDRHVHIYPGNYEDYLYRKAGGPEKTTVSLTASLKPPSTNSGAPGSTASSSTLGSLPQSSNGVIHTSDGVILSGRGATAEGPAASAAAEPPKAPIKRLNPIKLKQLEDRVAHIEQEIPRLESLIAAAEEHLGHYTSAEESQRTASELDQLRDQRTTLLAEWEELATSLEEQLA
jgi:ATP-binding cassette subfamily F protein 3